MDDPIVSAAVAAVVAVVATTAGLLPERLDLTHVFAAYGAGTVVGQAVGARGGSIDPATLGRRYGVGAMVFTTALWAIVLIGGLG